MIEIPDRGSFLRRWLGPAGWTLGVIALAALAWLLFDLLMQADNRRDVPVIVAVDRGSVTRTVSAYGKLLPGQNAVIQAGVEGTVEEILVTLGSRVDSGQPLVRLNNIDSQRRLEDTRIALMEARANLEAARARMERELLTARNEVRLAETDAELAAKKLEMLATLLQRNSISRMEYLQAELEQKRADLRVELSTRNLAVIEKATDAELRAEELRVNGAETRFQTAKDDIDRLVIRADRPGLLTVLAEELEIGAPVQRAQIVGQIADPESLYAEMFVTASEAGLLETGQWVDIKAQGLSLRGRVARVDPSVANSQVRVFVNLPDDSSASGGLRANVDVSARIVVGEVLDVPRLARPTGLGRDATHLDVFIENGKYLERGRLPLGLIGDDHVQINAELNPGRRVAVSYPESWAGRDRVAVDAI